MPNTTMLLLEAGAHAGLEQWAFVVTIFGFPLLLVSLYLASDLLKELIRIAQSQNTIALNRMVFSDPINLGILGAIETDKPILKDKGDFLEFQLDKYLGDFETVAMVYSEKLLTREQLEQHFSYYIQNLSSNDEVIEHLENNPEYFEGLRELIKLLKRTDGESQASALGT